MIAYVGIALLFLSIIVVVGKHRTAPSVAQFPRERWVRTVMFGRGTPYIGFTYFDRTKGNCIKGEDVAGLDDAAIKAKLAVRFPSRTLAAVPLGHPVEPLTADEIVKYELPAAPGWLSYYK